MSPSKELTQRQRRWELVHPKTGEVFNADSSDETLVEYLAWLADIRDQAQEHKSVIDQEILARMDENAAWTKHAGQYKLVGQSPAPVTEYDKERLAETLNALLKLGGEVAARIRECAREVPRDRRSVKVSRGR